MERPSSQQQQNGQSSAQGLFHFLPLNFDSSTAAASPRAQLLHAPALVHTSRPSTDLASPRPRWQRAPASISAAEFLPMRRKSSCGEPDDKYGPSAAGWGGGEDAANIRRMSHAESVLNTPQVRSQRLIGYSNPRYRWERYWKSDEELRPMAKKLRKYYERNNYLIQHYMYIDRLLDSSLPHDLIQEYQHRETSAIGQLRQEDLPETIEEERNGIANGNSNGHPNSHGSGNGNGPVEHQRVYPERHGSFDSIDADGGFWANGNVESQPPPPKVKRTPKDIYSFKASTNNSETALSDEDGEREPLLSGRSTSGDVEEGFSPDIPELEYEEEASSQSRIVTVAIVINVIANTALLIMKLAVVLLSSSVSVLASLVDAALDFLSTVIVGITTRLISRTDQYAFPIGRRRLEPVGVLVFSVIMITAFIQVLWEAISALTNGNHEIVQLTIPAIVIMSATVVVKGACWFWCRMIKNSSVQALAQDAATDVVFNTFSIIFPLIGYYAQIWWLDPLGGVFLSLYVIINWSRTANGHIMNLTGASASADERNILLYLTMRFAKTIKQIQGLQAYHSGDKLNVEVDIVLEETISLRDSHDLGESLQYVIESVPNGEFQCAGEKNKESMLLTQAQLIVLLCIWITPATIFRRIYNRTPDEDKTPMGPTIPVYYKDFLRCLNPSGDDY